MQPRAAPHSEHGLLSAPLRLRVTQTLWQQLRAELPQAAKIDFDTMLQA